MRYRIYSRTNRFLDALRKDIHEAKSSIYIEMYIFLDDHRKPYDFIEALMRKAER